MLVLEQVVVLWTRKCPTLRWRTVPGAFVMHCISHLSRDPDIAKPHTYMTHDINVIDLEEIKPLI